MKTTRRVFIAVLIVGLTQSALLAQTSVAPTFEAAVADIRQIAIASGTLVAGLVGLIGLGRTAYKLSQGDNDAMTSLIFSIVGIVIGFLANTFIV